MPELCAKYFTHDEKYIDSPSKFLKATQKENDTDGDLKEDGRTTKTENMF